MKKFFLALFLVMLVPSFVLAAPFVPTKLQLTMPPSVGYAFDKVHLKKGSYTPRGHTDIELEQGFIRRSFVQLFMGNKSFPVQLVKRAPQNDSKIKEKT